MLGALLLLSLTVKEDISFSNWQFKTTPFWIQSQAGANLILSPYANARARAARCEFRPAVNSSTALATWADAEWNRLLAGRSPTFLDKVRTTVFPRGVPGVQMMARFGSGASASTLRLIVFNPTGTMNAIVYTADDHTSYNVSSGLLDTLLTTVSFRGYTPGGGTKPVAPPVEPEKTKPVTPPTENPGDYKPTPTAGLGSPSPGYDPYASIDWDGPDIMVRSSLDHELTSNAAINREFAASASGLHSSVPVRPLTFEKAITNVKALFAKPSFSAAMTALRTNRQAFGSAGELQSAAFYGSLQGKTEFTLACLLVIHERSPSDATALFNLAGALAQQGMPNEALAVLAKMESLGKLPVMAWGFAPKACIAYVRGYSQMLIGKLPEARTSLEASVAADPNLTDAKYTLAIVEQAIGRSFKKNLYEGFTRVLNPQPMYCGGAYESDPSEEKSPINISIPVPKMFDLSQGKDGALPSLSHPNSGERLLRLNKLITDRMKVDMEEAIRLEKYAEGIYGAYLSPRLTGGSKKIQDRIDLDISRMINIDQTRMVELYRLSTQVAKAKKELADAADKVRKHVSKEILDLVKMGLKPEVLKARRRQLASQAINDLRPFAQAFDFAMRRRYKCWFKYATGVATSVTDPQWREYIDHKIKGQTVIEWLGLYSQVIGTYQSCALVSEELYQPDTSVALDTVSHQEIGMCDGALKNHKLEFKVAEFVSLKMTCDKVEFEASAPAKGVIGTYLGPFVSVSASKKGDATIYVGAKGSVGISPTGGASAAVTEKSGLAVKVDKSGVKEVALKVDFSASAGVGAAKVSTKIDEMSFIILPSPPTASRTRNHGLSLYGGGNP